MSKTQYKLQFHLQTFHYQKTGLKKHSTKTQQNNKQIGTNTEFHSKSPNQKAKKQQKREQNSSTIFHIDFRNNQSNKQTRKNTIIPGNI